jgi:lipid A ethanolaminephosphotransferase
LAILIGIIYKGITIKQFTQNRLILLVSAFFILFYNYTFFTNILKIYPINAANIGFLLSLVVLLFSLTAFVFTLFASKWTTKPLLIFTLLISAMTSYFMNTYNVVIDDSMIRNMAQTDMKESMDLLSMKQVLYFLFLGLLPAYVVYKTPVHYMKLKPELLSKLKQTLILTLIMGLTIFAFFKHYSSFVREHKPLRYTANPTYWIYSVGYYIGTTLSSGEIVVTSTGTDAKVVKKTNTQPKLVVLVVGEATRADHFALNGYHKETTPQLKKEKILNFSNVYSCGTSTAVSVPCMFSYYDKSSYSYKKGLRKENVLDVLSHTKNISILWRDNNSDSKGVALRVPYESYKSEAYNTICTEDECRDEGMLIGLDSYIHKQKNKDILIILHQMGNHGPAYYKRYPKAFEKFTPVCKTNQLEECSQEEINNAYDNAILYTDDFLVKTINLLKQYHSTHQTAMIYMSDHGESLGESGIYLHGLPYFMAPDAQIHIPALIWANRSLTKHFDLEKINTSKERTQDNLFHSLLGLFEVETEVYEPKLDIFNTQSFR